ncbi:MAG: PilN domain-containing protein [bacterium]|nr:PilN domain-containing protein [bacterium]MDZ4248292.1 PilN domain-containing protein [Patescibacteria group bacterium]
MYSHTLNLLPRKEQRRRRTDLLNYYTLVAGIVTVTGALVMAGLLLVFDQIYKVNLDDLQADKQLVESQAVAYLDIEKEAKGLEVQLDNLRQAEGQTTRWAALVSALRTMTPEGVSIKTVAFIGKDAAGQGAVDNQSQNQNNQSQITGVTTSRRALGQFQLALSESAFLKESQILNTTREGKVIQYTMSIEIDQSELEASQS